MTRNQKFAIGGIVLLAAFIVNGYVKYRMRHEDVIAAPVLKEDEKEKIIIDTGKKKVTRVRRDGTKQETDIKDGARKVVITDPKDGGDLKLEVMNKGFCFEPGLALYYSDTLRLGVDAQIAYYKNFGVLLGAGVSMGDEPRTVRAHIGLSHALPLNFTDNTSVFVGIDNSKNVAGGIRIKF